MSSSAITLPSRPWLYDCVLPASHPWLFELRRLEDSRRVGEAAVSANLAMEQRVEPIAQAEWQAHIDYTEPICTALNSAWEKSYVRPSPAVKFSGRPLRLPPSRWLTHVEPFAKLFRRAAQRPVPRAELELLLKSLTGQAGLIARAAAGSPGALAAALNDLDRDEFVQVVDLALRNVDGNGPRPFWWATLADEVSVHGDDATKICSSLGLAHYLDGDWVLVFDYPASAAGLLFRPTTLDSGGYPFHFPTEQEQVAGMTMPLRGSEPCCTELIHHALSPVEAAERVRPKVLELADAWSKDEVYSFLAPRRRAQRRILERARSSAAVSEWLARHVHRL